MRRITWEGIGDRSCRSSEAEADLVADQPVFFVAGAGGRMTGGMADEA